MGNNCKTAHRAKHPQGTKPQPKSNSTDGTKPHNDPIAEEQKVEAVKPLPQSINEGKQQS